MKKKTFYLKYDILEKVTKESRPIQANDIDEAMRIFAKSNEAQSDDFIEVVDYKSWEQ